MFEKIGFKNMTNERNAKIKKSLAHGNDHSLVKCRLNRKKLHMIQVDNGASVCWFFFNPPTQKIKIWADHQTTEGGTEVEMVNNAKLTYVLKLLKELGRIHWLRAWVNITFGHNEFLIYLFNRGESDVFKSLSNLIFFSQD